MKASDGAIADVLESKREVSDKKLGEIIELAYSEVAGPLGA